VFFKERWIHSKGNRLPLRTNFGEGGMKVLVEGLSKEHANVKVEGSTYRIGLVCDCACVSIDLSTLEKKPTCHNPLKYN